MEITPFQGFYSYQPIIADIPSAPVMSGADVSASLTDQKKAADNKVDKSGLGGLSKEMIGLLLEKGLPNDVQAYLISMEKAIENAYNPVTGKPNLAAYQLLIPKLNEIVGNYNEYKKAEDVLVSKNAVNDYAMSPDGRVLVMYLNDDKPVQQWMDYSELQEQFKGNMSQIHIVTNGELLKERAKNISYAFDQDVLTIIKGATGMQEITKYIKETLPTLGKTTNEVTYQQGGAVTASQEFQESVQALQDLVSGGTKYHLKETNQANQAALALNYIMGSMPDKMQQLLKFKAAKTGQTAAALVESYIGAGLNSERSESIVQGTQKKSDGSMKMNEAMQWLEGMGIRKTVSFQKGTSDAFGVTSNSLPVRVNGSDAATLITLDTINKSEFQGVLDLSQASAADVHIPAANTHDVVVQSGDLYKMDLPIDQQYYHATGMIKPDFSWLPKIQEAEILIKRQKCENDPDAINKIYQDLGLPIKYTEDGKTLTSEFYTFGVMNGYIPANIFGDNITFDKDFVQKITNEREIQNLLGTINRNLDENQEPLSLSKFGWGDHPIYATNIYIPVRYDVFNAMAGNVAPTISQAQQLYQKQQLHNVKEQAAQGFVSGGYPTDE